MRTGAGINTIGMSPLAPVTVQPHSPWHSPVPYLFGGLAAMLGLIAFALLILACSYWKLSGFLEGGRDGEDGGDLEGDGDGKTGGAAVKPPSACFQVVVIMPGDEKPTFLGTRSSSWASSFGDSEKNMDDEKLGSGEGGDSTQDQTQTQTEDQTHEPNQTQDQTQEQ